MKYTRKHLWLDSSPAKTDIGITQKGDELMGGITFVEVLKDSIAVESNKSAEELPNESAGAFVPYPVEYPLDFSKPVAYLPEGVVWKGELMDEDEYRKYCETL